MFLKFTRGDGDAVWINPAKIDAVYDCGGDMRRLMGDVNTCIQIGMNSYLVREDVADVLIDLNRATRGELTKSAIAG